MTDPEKSLIRHTYSFANCHSLRERQDEYAALEGLFLETMRADDPAVMLFTSGSTGKPKAVLLSAYNMLNSGIAFARIYHLQPEDIVCQILPMFHVLGMVCSLFGNMVAGGKVVIPKDNHVATILDTIQKEKCTQLYSVPTLLLAIAGNKSFDPSMVASLKCVMMGGAAVTAPQLEMLGKCFPNAFLATGYGLSEMAPVSLTRYRDSAEHVTKTVGKPMNDVEVCVQDISTHRKLPQGQSGEILVRGFNNMVCYYHLALDDQPIDEEGWIHTGDLGLLDEDGYIRLVGRAKELIIRGGENIAPGEIQEVISQFPNVADVKVQGVPDDFYGEVVGASVVMKDGASLDEDGLRQFLATRLAKYKIPKFIFRYDSFPMLSNGKVDAVSLKKDMNARAAAISKEGR